MTIPHELVHMWPKAGHVERRVLTPRIVLVMNHGIAIPLEYRGLQSFVYDSCFNQSVGGGDAIYCNRTG